MSKWDRFKKKDTEGGNTTPYPTMNLRQVVKKNGEVAIEQMIEHRNSQNQIINTEWVAIPTIYEG